MELYLFFIGRGGLCWVSFCAGIFNEMAEMFYEMAYFLFEVAYLLNKKSGLNTL